MNTNTTPQDQSEHKCFVAVNEQLKAKNTQLSMALAIVGNTMIGVLQVATSKADRSKRGRPIAISANYCPFCGGRL